jgi:hypothetical protein
MAEAHKFQPTDTAEVVSGSLKGLKVLVVGPSTSLSGFYDCVYHTRVGAANKKHQVPLSGNQLKLVKPGNGGANG